MTSDMLGNFVGFVGAILVVGSSVGATQQLPTPAAAPSFRSSVDLVRVSAVVRDRRGRFVRDLSALDFQVIDHGEVRRIVDFQHDRPGVSLALLIDVSGSMLDRLAGARQAAADLLAVLDRTQDEAGVFTFDTRLEEVEPFAVGRHVLPERLALVKAFGATSLYDAIASAAKRLADREGLRRAIVVFTDGGDTWSERTLSEAQAAASAIDVPVYIIGIEPQVENAPLGLGPPVAPRSTIGVPLENLAAWTGGRSFSAGTAIERIVAADQILAELRHQYLIAFEAGSAPGWHGLEVRAFNRELVVRARSGYHAGQSRPIS